MNSRPPTDNPYEAAAALFWDSVCEYGVMYLNEVKMPDIRWYNVRGDPNDYYEYHSWYVWPRLYADSIMIHHLFDDDYSEANSWMLEVWGLEGPYCFENVKVEKGDVVIDAGAYIGDWSAVAAVMGGDVYAFEPNPVVIDILNRCSQLNNFKVVQSGLGDTDCQKSINIGSPHGSQHIYDSPHSSDHSTDGPLCNLTTVDAFAERNNLHIDFLKADIEGYERNMLVGAKRVLTEDEPKLALRTYHNAYEDMIVLPRMLLEINPKYKIISRRNTMYAYV